MNQSLNLAPVTDKSNWKTFDISLANPTHVAEISVSWSDEVEAVEAAFDYAVSNLGMDKDLEIELIKVVEKEYKG